MYGFIGSVAERYRGMLQILRFNWPRYVLSLLCISAGIAAFPFLEVHSGLRVLDCAGICGCAFLTVSSLVVSHWVYDRSILGEWCWVRGCVTANLTTAANIHAGFDEATLPLRRLFPGADVVSWDIFDPSIATEGSIGRARAAHPSKAEPVSFKALPAAAGALDAVLLLFAAHELRSARARELFFAEVNRILRPGGTVLIAEHLRDVSNLLAFGPGFLHFLGAREWLRLAGYAGFELSERFTITPFVTVFRLTKPCAL
jgi:SAM-dependent methyltransferase